MSPKAFYLCRHQRQFSINVWTEIFGDWYASMFCHIGLQATTTEISSHMNCQSSWKVYHRQSQHECDTCVILLRHILAVLCEMSSITPIMTDGYVEEDHCMTSMLHARFESSGYLPVGTPKCGSCWQRTSHCGCLSDYPHLTRNLWSDVAVSRRALNLMEGHFDHFLWIYSISCNSQIKCFQTHVDMDCLLFWYV
jgi:hypothetical protein